MILLNNYQADGVLTFLSRHSLKTPNILVVLESLFFQKSFYLLMYHFQIYLMTEQNVPIKNLLAWISKLGIWEIQKF